jgi:hypothetical protein
VAVECAYCGSPDAPTVDHVPPRSIFPPPRPSTLRTVRSCVACNGGASKDDEYFRDVVLRYYRVADLPQAQQQVAAMIRVAAKPRKRAYASRILASFRRVAVRTWAGIVLGNRPAFSVNTDQFDRPIRRYIRGLYKFDTGQRLSHKIHIEIVSNPEVVLRSRHEIESTLKGGDVQTVQPGVFWYVWRRAVDNPDATIWLLVFFDTFPIFAVANRADRFDSLAV